MTPGEQVLEKVIELVFSPLYKLTVAIAFLYFLYGAFRFITDLNDPNKMNEGKNHLLYGTIGLFIIFSVGGFLKFFNDILGGLFTF
ncbi:MAG: Type secretion system pilin [Candidatus Parcubacteria bacterium]|jgi:hypothetical protein